jgi:mono/diheme cytochrome c family protein
MSPNSTFFLFHLALLTCAAAAPRDSQPPDVPERPLNHRFHATLDQPSGGTFRAGKWSLEVPPGSRFDFALEHPEAGPPVGRLWRDGDLVFGPEAIPELRNSGPRRPKDKSANTPQALPANPPPQPRVSFEPKAATIRESWVQELQASDHAQIVRGWNRETLKEGAKIYSSLCVTCHGTIDKAGSLPTALRFGEGEFKNGADPYSMFVTLTRGYGQMTPQPQFTTAQKYAVIHYIRETFLRPKKPEQAADLTESYLDSLPKGLARGEEEKKDDSAPQYQRMELGPALFWTLQVETGNIAQKGIAIRLDDGPGGVTKGRAWMVYDHDTMRLAAATTGEFVDWKGIAFDGSHGTHTSLSGTRHLVLPDAPGWASPEGTWDDARITGRDGKPYGPLPRKWLRYLGLYQHGDKAVVAAEVHGVRVLESPGWIEGPNPVFTRTLNIGPSEKTLVLRVAPGDMNVYLTGSGRLDKKAGFWEAHLPGGSKTRLFISKLTPEALAAAAKANAAPLDLDALTLGGPARWNQEIVTQSEAGEDAAFITDRFPLPLDNPWSAWLRPGGFDFTPDGKAAVIAMWNGDVWRVDGLKDKAPAALRWKRIAAGLFQPLGVKFRGHDVYLTCRDQIACLKDLNGDGETDFTECFNSDHQVTEHFHEFAMGLQTDDAGNFYYAKSGRHALDSVVPHHGTLLKVAADGAATEILATGFRAANGICINNDGSFFVTDQEGFWTPKNRINRVKPGGFYGNMYGYSPVKDTADSAMEQPMVWITNEKDRSPAELVWIPKNAWGALGGSLLNLSYGTGRAYIVPHELVEGAWQGAVCELPMPASETGIMRGRFASDGALYTCGMFAWAGNALEPGGFYRIRKGEPAANLPLKVDAGKDQITLSFSDEITPSSITPDAFAFKIWHLKRSAKYGSKHMDEHPLTISAASAGSDPHEVILTIPGLAPTQCYELTMKLRGADGKSFERSLHGTIHQLSN